MTHINPERRQFLQYAALGALTAGLPGLVRAEGSKGSKVADPGFKPDVEIALTAKVSDVSILPGPATHVFKYHGKLLSGPTSALRELPGYLGPILNFEQGQKVRIIFDNRLPEPCITHWHGLHVPQVMDGHPMYAIGNGEQYVYEFEVKNPAGTYWYHAHTHELTATQVYQGLAGLITVADTAERKLGLPEGEFDIPLVIQDRHLTSGNQLRYVLNRHQQMTGFLGDTFMINGQRQSTIPVKTRAYRLRILNGSNSRIYKLAWQDGSPMIALASDGGLLEKPQSLPYIMLAPAERIEIWADFSGRKPGSELVLQSLGHQATTHMGGGMGRMGGMGQQEVISLVKFQIAEQVSDSPALPSSLIPMQRFADKDFTQPERTVPIAIGMRHMTFQLNGRTFDMQDYMEIEKIPLNSVQRIRISHTSGMMRGGRGRGGRSGMGMMMSMPHPIHLHGQQFQILSRRQNHPTAAYDTVKDGFVDSGWKDTVLVMPDEEIEIAKPFRDYAGLFLYHCHNLEHEDMGMMRHFHVG